MDTHPLYNGGWPKSHRLLPLEGTQLFLSNSEPPDGCPRLPPSGHAPPGVAGKNLISYFVTARDAPLLPGV